MSERIESQKHPVIQTLRDVQEEKGRERLGLFHVEGEMIVRRALNYGGRVAFVMLTNKFADGPGAELAANAHAAGTRVYVVTEGLMAKAVPGKPPPGVVACVERRLCDPAELLSPASPLLFLIDRCENPDNLGMLLRSLDAAGVDGVACTSDGADPFSRLSVRASRGSVLSLKIAVVAEPERWLERAKEKEFGIVASSARATKDIWSMDFTGPVVVVVGNEHTGVRQSIRELADSIAYIPMAGKMESLNIAVAGAVIAYEAARQRRDR